MFIISPKWIYLNNKKLEKDKSLIIDGSFIKDIIETKSIEKDYNKLERINYPNHILMPTFTESYINMDDCSSQLDFNKKLKMLVENGVTKIQVASHAYNKLISYEDNNNVDISYVLSFDGKDCNQSNIKDVIKLLDFYKTDPTKIFSLNLINILDFKSNLIEKIASISNEINLSIHIQGSAISKIKEKNKIKEIISFWDKINLLNNCYLHDFFYKNECWYSHMNKKSIKLMINYNTLDSADKLKSLSSLIENKYICILISNKNNMYNLYRTMKLVDMLDIRDSKSLGNKIIDCVTINTSDIFIKSSNSEYIKKGALASFNIFDYSINNFFIKKDSHNLCNLDNQSLSNVWSAGKHVILKYE